MTARAAAVIGSNSLNRLLLLATPAGLTTEALSEAEAIGYVLRETPAGLGAGASLRRALPYRNQRDPVAELAGQRVHHRCPVIRSDDEHDPASG